MRNAKSIWNLAVSLALALGLTAGLMATSARAEDKAAGKGSLTGKVVDKDGAAVSGAEVLLFKAPEKGQGKAKKEAAALNADDAAKAEKKKPEAVATATTDSDGKFAFKDLAAGDYVVRTRIKGSGAANSRVTVAAGSTAEVNLQLAPGGAKKDPADKAEKAAKKAEKAEKKAKKQ